MNRVRRAVDLPEQRRQHAAGAGAVRLRRPRFHLGSDRRNREVVSRYILGIDAGTSVVTAALFGRDFHESQPLTKAAVRNQSVCLVMDVIQGP